MSEDQVKAVEADEAAHVVTPRPKTLIAAGNILADVSDRIDNEITMAGLTKLELLKTIDDLSSALDALRAVVISAFDSQAARLRAMQSMQ